MKTFLLLVGMQEGSIPNTDAIIPGFEQGFFSLQEAEIVPAS